MKVLFIHSHKFRKIDSRIYSLGGLAENVLKRYINNEEDTLTVVSRIVYEEESKSNYSEIKDSRIKIKNISNTNLKNEILNADIIIIRLPCIIGNVALKFAKKYKKPYIVEVVGCVWDSYWNHGLLGKIAAPISYLVMKHNVMYAPYVLYVSKSFLQKRYPTKGKNIACSDVLIKDTDNEILNSRLKNIQNLNNKKEIVIGTIGAVNVKYKGQQYIINALKKLEKEGYNIVYELIGSGNNEYLKKIAKDNNVLEKVKFMGSLEHNEIFNWLDKIDIYVQPSNQEGLCRSVVEALSRACPCILSDAGGNVELVSSKYIFKRKKINDFIRKIINLINEKEMKKQATQNFNKSKLYSYEVLEQERRNFYKEIYRRATEK